MSDENKAIVTPGGYLPSGDHVKANLLKAGAAPDQVDAVLWLLTFGRSEKIAHVSKLAKRLNVSAATLSKVFGGKYGADLGNIAGKIEHFRKLQAERSTLGEIPLVRDLRVVRDISDFCELTRVTASMSTLFGPNQSGKSWALKNVYTPAHNHGRTIYTSLLDNGGATRLFMEDLLAACSISERKSYGEMKRRIFRYFDPQTLLIVDEFHQTMVGRTLKMPTIEFIRSIHEKTGCGVVLCGTDILPDMFDDPRYKKFLGQIANRGALRRLIPATPYPEDVVALCRAYGFGEAPAGSEEAKLVAQIASSNGIGKLCKYFVISRRLANGRKEPLQWEHFLATHATLKSWERGEQMKEGGAK